MRVAGSVAARPATMVTPDVAIDLLRDDVRPFVSRGGGKLAAALDQFGSAGTFTTEVLADTPPNDSGVVTGDLWLRGGGDPAFGSATYVRRHYGPDAASVTDVNRQTWSASTSGGTRTPPPSPSVVRAA